MILKETPFEFVGQLVDRFAAPLQAAQTNVLKTQEEFKSLMQYTVQFISIVTMEYHAVWWQIFHVPTASEWVNALIMVQLLFSPPTSNGNLERVFFHK